MTEVPVTIVRLSAVIWLVLWRGAVVGGLLGALGGALVGIIAVMAGSPGRHPVAAGLAGLALSMPWYFLVFRMAFKKQYHDFRIVMIAR